MATRAAVRNLRKIVDEVLNEKVDVAENGRRRKVTKLELVIRQLVNKAAAGEIRNATLLLKVLVIGMPTSEDTPVEQVLGGKEDEQLLADLLQQHGVPPAGPEADNEPR